jgi:hypothetical protein
MPRTVNIIQEKCHKQYPCGGCIPNPPEDCPLPTKGYCGKRCQEAVLCAYKCKRLNCTAYKAALALVKERHKEDCKKAPKESMITDSWKEQELPLKPKSKRTIPIEE